MRYLELCTLTESQIADLLGLMKELNAELKVTPEMQRRAVAAPGTRIFAAENDAKQIVGCATLCVYESPTGRQASVEDVVVASVVTSMQDPLSKKQQGAEKRLLLFTVCREYGISSASPGAPRP